MKIALLAVSVLLASTAFAREEDSPLPIEDATPKKAEKAVIVKPSQPVFEETIKQKPAQVRKVLMKSLKKR